MSRKKAKPPARTPDELLAAGQQHAERGELTQAQACYREALATAPDHLGALSLLGLLLVELGDVDGAIDLLAHARELAPGFAPIHLALGGAYAAAGFDDLAVGAMEAAIKIDATSTVPLERLAKHHILMRRSREAIGLLRRVLRRDPSHAQARFLLAGLTGERSEVVDAPPSDWIADLFNTYAGSFDRHLTEELQYAVPASLTALIAGLGVAADASRRVVDLGCGTGLAGVELRGYARTLIGSDLSARMIARARHRAIYDELQCEDLTATLAREREVDLIVAADVFIYVGPLEATFAACATALRPGGLLAFSVERGDDAVALRPTLRYAHSDAYVRGLASTHGYTVERAEASVLRVDNGEPVHGMLYVLSR